MDRQKLRQQLERHEGKRSKAYMDHLGNVTVGIGRNLTGKGLSEDEIHWLLDNDIDECVADLETFPWWRDLDEVRQRAVCDLRFNLGPTRFRTFTRLMRGLATGDFALAGRSAEESLWYRQVKTRGPRIVHMLRTGTDPT